MIIIHHKTLFESVLRLTISETPYQRRN